MSILRITRLILLIGFFLAVITACNVSEPQPLFPAPSITSATFENGDVHIAGENIFQANPGRVFSRDLTIEVCGTTLGNLSVAGQEKTVTVPPAKVITITAVTAVTGTIVGAPTSNTIVLMNPDGQQATATIACDPSDPEPDPVTEPDPKPTPEPSEGAMFLDIDLSHSGNRTFTLRLQGVGDVIINWGDGTFNELTNPTNPVHEYPEFGTYEIAVSGMLDSVEFGGYGGTQGLRNDAKAITALHTWGEFTYLEDGLSRAFEATENLTTVPDYLPGEATILHSTFAGASHFNQDISGWDVALVEDMERMFEDATAFSHDLSEWCVERIMAVPEHFATNAGFADRSDLHPNWGWPCIDITDEMVLTIDLTLSGQLTYWLPIRSDSEATIDWGDGTIETLTLVTANAPHHDYDELGQYRIIVSGDIIVEKFGTDVYSGNNNPAALVALHTWGDFTYWGTSLESAFENARNLVITPAMLPTGPTSLQKVFRGASNFDGDISGWNTENITRMNQMFYGASRFNQDISSWNTANVKNMDSMFYQARNFNQDIGEWDTANVTNMFAMFFSATNFDADVGSWNTARVQNMEKMFYDTASFNQDLSSWVTEKVSNMKDMFGYATSFNGDISDWNTSNVKGMSGMFSQAASFNQDLSEWDTARVTNMSSMFSGASSFNQDISEWKTENVSNMSYMFSGASSFNQDIGGWDTSKVAGETDMHGVFLGATVFSQDLSGWCVEDIPHEPYRFRLNAGFANNDDWQPVWGTCPSSD